MEVVGTEKTTISVSITVVFVRGLRAGPLLSDETSGNGETVDVGEKPLSSRVGVHRRVTLDATREGHVFDSPDLEVDSSGRIKK